MGPLSTVPPRGSTGRSAKEIGGWPRNPMDSFLTACGLTAPLTLAIEGPGLQGPEMRSYPQPFVLIGRDERSDLLLDHDLVSRRHTYLQMIEGRVFFVDLDSRSGTFFGGSLAESGWLSTGDTLTIGPYSIKLALPEIDLGTSDDDASNSDSGFEFSAGQGGQPLNPLLARSSEVAALPRISLEFQSRTAGHSVWRMSQVLALVGSSPRCKVRLLDSNVSKLHCALLRTVRGLWVIDLLGRGGITVSGASVRFATLETNDVLGLGQVIVRPNFEDPDERGRSPSGATGIWNTTSPAKGLPATQGALTPRSWGQGPPVPQPHPSGVSAYHQPPWPPAAPEISGNEPGLSLLLNHFGQMQQHMLDQFQSSMMMMMQMFNGMHRDQMGLVREELDRLRELGDEIQQIKARLGPQAPNPVPQATPPPYSLPPGLAAPWQGNAWPPAGRLATPLNGSSPRSDSPRPPNGSAPGAGPPNVPNPFAARPQQPRQAPAKPPGAPAPREGDDGEVHDWLNERLAVITKEQQTRWQKIMGMLKTNKSS